MSHPAQYGDQTATEICPRRAEGFERCPAAWSQRRDDDAFRKPHSGGVGGVAAGGQATWDGPAGAVSVAVCGLAGAAQEGILSALGV